MPTPKHLLFALALAALTAVIAGCFGNSAKSRVTSDYVATVKNVGVISLLSPGVNISHLAPSAQESAFSTVELAGWNTDRIAFDATVSRLKRKGFNVRPLARNAVMNKARSSDWRQPLVDSVAEEAYAMGAANGLDVVVVVQAQVDEDFVTKTNQRIRGFGLQQAFDTGPYLYATILVEAYDIKNRFAVGRATGRLSEEAPAELWRPSFEQRGQPAQLSPALQAALAEPLGTLLHTAIGIAAQEAGL